MSSTVGPFVGPGVATHVPRIFFSTLLSSSSTSTFCREESDGQGKRPTELRRMGAVNCRVCPRVFPRIWQLGSPCPHLELLGPPSEERAHLPLRHGSPRDPVACAPPPRFRLSPSPPSRGASFSAPAPGRGKLPPVPPRGVVVIKVTPAARPSPAEARPVNCPPPAPRMGSE